MKMIKVTVNGALEKDHATVRMYQVDTFYIEDILNSPEMDMERIKRILRPAKGHVLWVALGQVGRNPSSFTMTRDETREGTHYDMETT